MTSKSLVFHQYIGFSNHDDPCSKNSTKLTVWCTKTMPLFVCLYRYFSIFVCHNKMNNKIKGFMENVGFVSFVLTWPKLFQPFQLHKSNWAYMVNTKFTSKKRNLASLQAVYVSRQMLCNRPFHSCGLSILAFEWTWGWGWSCFDTNLLSFLMKIILKNTS